MVPRTRQLQLVLCIAAFFFAACSAPESAPPADAGSDLGRDGGPFVDAAQADAAADSGTEPFSSGCNPLAPSFHCLLPYPSDVFLVDGKVQLGGATPRDKYGDPVRAFDARPVDGFSVLPVIIFSLDVPLDPQAFVAWNATESSIAATSPTLLLDATTGEAIPHFSEVYEGTDDSVEKLVAAIRPLKRLENDRRYIVAVQNLTSDGAPAPATPSFVTLRDGAAPEELARYESDVFAPLATFGVDRANLQLAWDFTTRTSENLTGDMFAIRDGTLAWLETNEPTVTILEINEGEDLESWLPYTTFRHVEGKFTAPQWVVEDVPGTELAGSPGAREIVGTVEVEFSLLIPNSLEDGTYAPGPFLQYGHGFFGGRDEVISFVQSDIANELGYVMGAIDWKGMTVADRNWVVPAITADPANAFGFVPRLYQAMANQLVFTHVVQNQLVNLPAVAVNDAPAYDPAQVGFFGISQGHILGGTFAALTPSIERIALNVGGASFGLIMSRSYAFLLFERVLAQWFKGPDLLAFEAVAPLVLEPVDPIAFAPYVITSPRADAAPRQIMLQGGLGDTAVPTVAIETHARSLGIPLITPSAASVPFIETTDGPAPSGLTLVDYGVDASVARIWKPVNVDTPTHEGIRRMPVMREQMRRFFAPDGMVENTCGGACVLE